MGHVVDRWTRPGPDGKRQRTTRWGRGKRWLARWVDDSGQERSQACVSRDEATAVFHEMERAVRRGEYVDPGAGRKVTVGDVAEQWLAGKAARKRKTIVGYESLWRSHVGPRWATTPVSRVTHADAAAWVAQLMATGLSASRVRQAHGVLAGVMGLAVRTRLVSTNPCTGVDLPRAVSAPQQYLTHRDVLRLIDAAEDVGGAVAGAIIAVLAYTGLRLGEMLGLRVQDLDAGRRRLRVEREVVEVGGQQHVDTPKSHHRREVPLSGALTSTLQVIASGRPGNSPLLPAPAGGVWWQRNFRSRVWEPATAAVGLTVTPHELRHTAASLAIGAGADVKVVQRMLGHASASMTLDLYGHLLEDRLDDVAEALSQGAATARAARSRDAVTDQGRTRDVADVVDLAARRSKRAL